MTSSHRAGEQVKAKVTWRCRSSRICRAFASECQMQTMVALLLLLLMMMLLLLLPLTSAGHARPQREQSQARRVGAEWKSRTRIRCLCDV